MKLISQVLYALYVEVPELLQVLQSSCVWNEMYLYEIDFLILKFVEFVNVYFSLLKGKAIHCRLLYSPVFLEDLQRVTNTPPVTFVVCIMAAFYQS